MAQNTKTPVMVLQELTVKKGFAPPNYQLVYSITGSHENRFDFAVSVAGVEAEASGSSKQIAKHQAAHNALMLLKDIGIYNPSDNPVTEFKVPLRDDNSSYKAALNCISDLQNICLESKFPPPIFNEVSSVGPPHAREFTYECKVAAITTEAKGSTKKMAKHLAAKLMLERVRDFVPEQISSEQNDQKNQLRDKEESLAADKYNELREVVPDKSIKVEEMSHGLPRLMKTKDLTYEDFREDLQTHTEEQLKKITEKLEVKYNVQILQANPYIVLISLGIDTTFVVIAKGKTVAEALQKALDECFDTMELFMQIEVKDNDNNLIM